MNLEGVEIIIEKTERRKTVSIFIERNGSVRVLAPLSITDERIEVAVKVKQYQIFSKLAKWKELNHGKVKRQFVNGQSFLYLGRNYRLSIVDCQDVPLKITGGYFRLDKKFLDQAEKIFKEYYRNKAEQKIKERIEQLGERFSTKPVSIKVLDLQNRWASCTTQNKLNFHWKCIMAPMRVLDYIITHEMVHLKYGNHSAAFWDELDKKMPNYRECKDWLKLNGVKMDF